jgi:CO/xanthine dehydrogenase FAD-binding subunit
MVVPRNLAIVLEMVASDPGVWRPFAGGTDLMVLFEAGKLPHRKFVSIWNLQGLRQIEVAPEFVVIGALATYTQIRRHEVLQKEFPLLCRAAAETGSIATQNRGTIGGNIANASPAADSPPALAVYEAEIELVSTGGIRRLPYRAFHTGYKQMQIRPDELIARIFLPRMWDAEKSYYRKVGTRRAQAISKVCFAGAIRLDGERIAGARIALGSVAPTVIRAGETEKFLRGEKMSSATIKAAQEILAREVSPIDDIRSTAAYRRRVTQNLLAEFLESATA